VCLPELDLQAKATRQSQSPQANGISGKAGMLDREPGLDARPRDHLREARSTNTSPQSSF
jgi:hypothetical protein